MNRALDAAYLIDRLDRLSRNGATVHGLNGAQWEALRYLARANRFSRTPAALSDYLGSTRGTVSQTLIALEEKGFVSRRASKRDRRSVDLSLTGQGRSALADDPIRALAADIAHATRNDPAALADALQRTLRAALVRNGGQPFGICRNCQHFGRDQGEKPGPHLCTLLNQPLTTEDSLEICVEYTDRESDKVVRT